MYEITPQSMASVQKQIDKVTEAGMSIDDMMFKITKGPMQKAIRADLYASGMKTKEKKKPIFDKEETYVTIQVRHGKGKFRLIMKPSNEKGRGLMEGRHKKGTISVKNRKSSTGKGQPMMELGASRGKRTGDYRSKVKMGQYDGVALKATKVAERAARKMLRHEISKRVKNLGPMGGSHGPLSMR